MSSPTQTKLIEYYTQTDNSNHRNLRHRNAQPFKTYSDSKKFSISLKFNRTKVLRLELKNYNSLRLTIEFLLNGSVHDEMVYSFTESEKQDTRIQKVDIDSDVNEVRLTFERSEYVRGVETGLYYFFLYESKVPASSKKDYMNLSETHMLSDRKNVERSPNKGGFLSSNSYHPTIRSVKNQAAQKQTNTKNIKKDRSNEKHEKKIDNDQVIIISEDSLNNKIQILCEKKQKGLLKQEFFNNQIQRLFAQKQQKQKSNKKPDRKSEAKEDKTRNSTTHTNKFGTNKEHDSKTSSKNRTNQRSNSIQARTVIIQDTTPQQFIKQQDYKHKQFFQASSSNFPEQQTQQIPTIRLTDKQIQYMRKITKAAKDIQLQFQVLSKVPVDKRISEYIAATTAVKTPQKYFCLSGFTEENRDRLRMIGKKVGLQYTQELVDNCILVATGTNNPKVRNMRNYTDCVAVTKEYLEDCQREKRQLKIESKYILK